MKFDDHAITFLQYDSYWISENHHFRTLKGVQEDNCTYLFLRCLAQALSQRAIRGGSSRYDDSHWRDTEYMLRTLEGAQEDYCIQVVLRQLL